jgi:RNA polymerase sigma factor (sigma-70 family)
VVLREVELDLLMSRLAAGDRSAFAPLFLELQPRALRLAQRRVGVADGADVAQQALERVFARASEFAPGRSCLAWFYGILANELTAARRRQARLALADSPADELATDDGDAEAQLLARELDQALEGAIEQLDGDAAAAIAALLERSPPPPNVKPATFRKRLSRAYARLRLLLGSDHAN